MAKIPIKLKSRALTLHSAFQSPDFESRTVLSSDLWNYVSLWIKRSEDSNRLASFYWKQAEEFFKASANLSVYSSPLTLYYSILNATKALLIIKNIQFTDHHGVSGESKNTQAKLTNEIISLKGAGILISLKNYYCNGSQTLLTTSLFNILYNLSCVHRAFVLTFPKETDLFLSCKNLILVQKNGNAESYLEIELNSDENVREKHFPVVIERDTSYTEKTIFRMKSHFKKPQNDELLLKNLTQYNLKIRKYFFPIYGETVHWYMKKNVALNKKLDDPTPILIFMALHRLSELSRYAPEKLERHFDTQHGWLLSEFLKIAPMQFIRQIASEITGQEFISPYSLSL